MPIALGDTPAGILSAGWTSIRFKLGPAFITRRASRFSSRGRDDRGPRSPRSRRVRRLGNTVLSSIAAAAGLAEIKQSIALLNRWPGRRLEDRNVFRCRRAHRTCHDAILAQAPAVHFLNLVNQSCV